MTDSKKENGMAFRVSDTGFRIVLLVLATIAVLSFSYNQIAQARSVRFRQIESGLGLVFDTWNGRLCVATADCWPLVNDTLVHRRGEPVHIPSGVSLEDSTR